MINLKKLYFNYCLELEHSRQLIKEIDEKTMKEFSQFLEDTFVANWEVMPSCNEFGENIYYPEKEVRLHVEFSPSTLYQNDNVNFWFRKYVNLHINEISESEFTLNYLRSQKTLDFIDTDFDFESEQVLQLAISILKKCMKVTFIGQFTDSISLLKNGNINVMVHICLD